ncbi:hypothetical protein FDT66_09660 [Polaribacter aestuariivivens]|uniref:Uncharacterized protein n=1 Tax=Polaribacter aestuariivivens TaxID=2304626 RepID=A0A5S3N4L6_9FLAO|nr:hypothetical protein [Polaribacter aestuariivivens]TMM29384.1 hypothetical protein FDT66_09660 [Polaribacter aestuariivivens]
MKKKHNTIIYLLFISFFLYNTSIIAQNKTSNAINILPPEINSEIYFGMNLADFKNLIGSNLVLESNNVTDFRIVYSQKTKIPEIPIVFYYFDNEQNKPLYEIVINYQNKEQAKKAATLLFGQPNFNQTEWRINIQGFPEAWSWVYKNKLIVAAKIYGSEWFDEWNKE